VDFVPGGWGTSWRNSMLPALWGRY